MKRLLGLPGLGMLVLAASMATVVLAHAKSPVPLQAVASVNLNEYASQPWYEVASIPFFFQKGCAKNAMAQYTLLPQKTGEPLQMVDQFDCDKANGKHTVITGRVKVVDTETNAKLSATFLNILGWRYWFGTNYWIMDLGPHYEYSVVGNPDRKLGWILSRTPLLPLDTLKEIATRLTAQGYDTCKFMLSPQSRGITAKTPLCEFIK